MHRYTEETERIAQLILDYSRHRLQSDPVPLNARQPAAELASLAGQTISAEGIGGEEALRVFTTVLAPACVSTDHPRYLSFIPCAPTELATLFDLAVSASSIYGGSSLDGAGAVFAENQALRWLTDLAEFPREAGGVFVPGATLGNLSALVAARHNAQRRRAGRPPGRWKVAAADQVHSSIAHAATVMDFDVLTVPVDERGRLSGATLARALDAVDGDGLFAVVATAGTTNCGIIDDLQGVAAVARERSLWFHVDAAYGGAGLAAPSVREKFRGIEQADSFVVDPHKWLFAPFDCCALLYREPEVAQRAHAQVAGYLEPVNATGAWNPSDYAVHLTRRARGLPFWFSLAAHGTRAYSEAVECTLAVAQAAAAEVSARAYLRLLREPDLSVIVFRRLGWAPRQYHEWSDRLMQANFAFVTPTTHEGEVVARLAIVNPRTTEADIVAILDTMA